MLAWHRHRQKRRTARRKLSVHEAGFNLEHLRELNADPHWFAQFLCTLRQNLIEERQRLHSTTEWQEPLHRVLHRLSGLACTIDAPGLLRICQEMELALERAPAGIGEHLERLQACLSALIEDVERSQADQA